MKRRLSKLLLNVDLTSRRLTRHRPLVREVVEGEPQAPLECAFDAARGGRLEDLADDLVAPFLADVGPEGVPEAVRENAWVVRELLNRRQMAFQGRVAQPHRRVRIDRTDGEVFRHPLHKPQRRGYVCEALDPGPPPTPAGDVALAHGYHLVAHD